MDDDGDIHVEDFTWRKAPGVHPSPMGKSELIVMQGFVDGTKYIYNLHTTKGFADSGGSGLDSFLLSEFKRWYQSEVEGK